MADLLEYEIGCVADAFSFNVEKRIEKEKFNDTELKIAIDILREELFKSLRILENSIPRK